MRAFVLLRALLSALDDGGLLLQVQEGVQRPLLAVELHAARELVRERDLLDGVVLVRLILRRVIHVQIQVSRPVGEAGVELVESTALNQRPVVDALQRCLVRFAHAREV